MISNRNYCSLDSEQSLCVQSNFVCETCANISLVKSVSSVEDLLSVHNLGNKIKQVYLSKHTADRKDY